MDFNCELQNRQNYINTCLRNYLPEEEGFQKTVIEALNYSINVGGKRLRPIFMQEIFRLYSLKNGVTEPDYERIEPFLCAIEMIHTYSLVHDDLPAMDNDFLRRGYPTTHAKYGHAMGILAGDALLNYSVETACKAFLNLNSKDEPYYDGISNDEWNLRVAKAMKLLYTRAGIYGMIGGQTLDVEKNGEALTTEEINFIFELKTCALISVSILIGAVLGGASEKDLAVLEPLGYDIGMAFQIRDDILDVIADTEVLGKPVGSDEKNNKTTYVTMFGMDAAVQKVKEYSEDAIKIAEALPDHEFLKELILRLVSRNK